jgi:hypothetical protein
MKMVELLLQRELRRDYLLQVQVLPKLAFVLELGLQKDLSVLLLVVHLVRLQRGLQLRERLKLVYQKVLQLELLVSCWVSFQVEVPCFMRRISLELHLYFTVVTILRTMNLVG